MRVSTQGEDIDEKGEKVGGRMQDVISDQLCAIWNASRHLCRGIQMCSF
jgi:hypothetical protein